MSEAMVYISTNGKADPVSFKEAVLSSMAPDGGLFVPAEIPMLDQHFRKQMLDFTKEGIAFSILQPYIGNDLTNLQLSEIVSRAFTFEFPIKKIGDRNIYALELFHGPTWAFKDVGSRFLAGCLSAWTGQNDITILVATSGDTGGAVANGFYQQKGTRVVVLYPFEKITALQEQQIAGLGENITAIAVNGNFDDCQRLVKQAFADDEVRKKISLTSANSINIARWLPQMLYYALAYKTIHENEIPSVICVPCGNYGNITAGILLHQMGFAFEKFMAAHNANDTIPRFLQEHKYDPHTTIPTLANAMDVSDPSNFARLQYLWDQDLSLKEIFTAHTVTDEQILQAIRDCWHEHHYLLDPHAATAWDVLRRNGNEGLLLATAHPQKFEDVIVKALGFFPDSWRRSFKSSVINRFIIDSDYSRVKNLLMGN